MWSVLIPFKGAPGAKSRFTQDGISGDARAQLAEAFLTDVVNAVLGCARVTSLTVVTPRANSVPTLGEGVVVREEPDGTHGLNAAVSWGLSHVAPTGRSVAVITGDLPLLTAGELSEIFELAEAHERSLVPDADGTGTTMLLFREWSPIEPQFGPGSRIAHERLGFVTLELDPASGARRDVDTVAQLSTLPAAPGSATNAVLHSQLLR